MATNIVLVVAGVLVVIRFSKYKNSDSDSDT